MDTEKNKSKYFSSICIQIRTEQDRDNRSKAKQRSREKLGNSDRKWHLRKYKCILFLSLYQDIKKKSITVKKLEKQFWSTLATKGSEIWSSQKNILKKEPWLIHIKWSGITSYQKSMYLVKNTHRTDKSCKLLF